jgi:hypothetical protein
MKRFNLLWIGLLVIGLSACLSDQEYSQEEVQQLMQAELDRRITNFKTVRAKRCREELLEQAVTLADSILLVESRASVKDPGRPARVERPELRRPKDSLPIAPLFRRDSLIPAPDTSLRRDTIGEAGNRKSETDSLNIQH